MEQVHTWIREDHKKYSCKKDWKFQTEVGKTVQYGYLYRAPVQQFLKSRSLPWEVWLASGVGMDYHGDAFH